MWRQANDNRPILLYSEEFQVQPEQYAAAETYSSSFSMKILHQQRILAWLLQVLHLPSPLLEER